MDKFLKPKGDKENKTIEKDGQIIPKKLKEFYDPKSPQTKKFKSLVSYCESAPSPEVKGFFEKEAYNVWAVFLDTFQYYEQQQKISKKDDKANILEKILYVENKHEIRMQGLELLLMFLEDLETPEPSQSNILAAAIDLEMLKGEYQKKIILPFKPPSATDKNAILFPSSIPPTPSDSVALIDSMLNYMGSPEHAASFPLLWKLFRAQYLQLLFPDICKDLGLVERFSDAGFPNFCPRDVVAVLISKIGLWSSSDVIMRKIWTDKENTAIMLELFRQASVLPIKHVETTRQAVQFYRRLFFGTAKEPIPQAIAEQKEQLISFQRFFVEQLPAIFKNPSTPQTAEQLATLCVDVLKLLKEVFESGNISSEIRDVLLFTLLQVTTTLLKPDNPNQELAKSLAAYMVDVLLYLWISSRITNVEMWTRLHEGLQSLFHRIEPVVQVRIKLVQLTLILRNFIFTRIKPKRTPDGKLEKLRTHSLSPDDRKRSKSESDSAMESLQWDYDTVRFIWDSLLQMFKGFSRIKEPAIFAEAVGAITEIIEIFLEAEYKTLNRHILDPDNSIPPIHLLNTFGAGLFEACNRDDNYIAGKAKAFASLSRLICRHYNMFPGYYSPDILPYFYTTIHYALCNPPHDTEAVSYAIIEYSSNIFNLGLPGATILIPYYLVEINRLLRGHKPPLEVRRKAIIITCSVICYASQFGDLEIPTRYYGHFQKQKGKEIWDNDAIKCVKFRDQISAILVNTLKTDDNLDIDCMCLWGIAVLIFDSFTSQPDMTLINDLIKIVFSYATSSEWTIAVTALDVISSFTSIAKDVMQTDKKFFGMITEGLCANITSELKDSKKEREFAEKIVCHHFFCLTDIIMAVPSIMDNPDLVKRVFGAIQLALTNATSVDIRKESLNEKKKMKKDIKDGRPDSTPIAAFEPVRQAPSAKESARFLLLHLLNFHRNFPSLQGIEFSSSQVVEPDDTGLDEAQPSHFVYKNSVLLSFVEINSDAGGHTARLFARDASGKYVWDCRFKPDSQGMQQSLVSLLAGEAGTKDPLKPREERKIVDPARKFSLFEEQQEPVQVDQVDEVLKYLGETHPDCLPENQKSLNQPTMLPAKFLTQIVTVQKSFVSQQTDDNKLIQEKKDNKPSWAAQPPKEASSSNALQFCRLLLSHLGLMDYDNMEDIHQLDNNKSFQLKLRNLDKQKSREITKIGLVYVKDGQDEQGQIFGNEDGSPMYEEFAAALAWPVNLSTHKGYNGGLDQTNGSNGLEAPYWTSAMMEGVFHEVVKMPTVKTDPQQLQKKRHVGNDIVHIIYSEHSRDYPPKTIVSQFNDAHIIIYPLSNGMFRVQVAKKEKVMTFGPLIHGMCVTKRLMPILARLTAINAHRCIRLNTEGYERPFFARSSLIQEIISKSTRFQDYQSLLESAFTYNSSNIESQTQTQAQAHKSAEPVVVKTTTSAEKIDTSNLTELPI